MINLFEPTPGPAEVESIERVFDSHWLGAGERLAEFESAFAAHLGTSTDRVLSIASCTEGLFQAVASLDLGPGDEVVLPSVSFIGAAHAIKSTGADIVLCDVDDATLNPSCRDVEQALSPRTRAIVMLHFGGLPGSVEEIAALARDRGIVLIEDAACALGSSTSTRACGTIGDIGVWSFDSMKVLSCGDGGMVWCADPVRADGIRRSTRLGGAAAGFSQRSAERWWEIDPPSTGRRAAMNDVTAAIGLRQLARLPSALRRKESIASAYDAALADLPWLVGPPVLEPGATRTFYWVQLTGDDRDALAQHLLDRGVYTSFRYWPLHRTSLFRTTDPLPGAQRASERTLLLPLHGGLSDLDVDCVIEMVRAFSPSVNR